MTTRPDVMALDQQHVFPTYARTPVVFVRGDGVTLFDAQGKAYLDFLSGIAVNALGYNHPRVVAALSDQSAKVLHVSNLFHNEYQARLATKLCEVTGLSRVFFCNSGAEANEAAIKLARNRAFRQSKNGANRKYEYVALRDSFHGRTLGALSVTGQEKYQIPFAPLIPGVKFVPVNDVSALTEAVTDAACAVILEPILGEGGIQVLTRDFLKVAREACDRHSALLIFDEVQCGMGRTGHYLASHGLGIRPDLVTLAKPLGLGIPMGALLGAEQFRDDFAAGMHGSTFGGGPLACRLSLEFLAVLEEERLLERIRNLGDHFKRRLMELKSQFPFVKEVRGAGLMLGMELESPGKSMARSMLDRGFIINCAHEKVLRFLPPYLIRQDQIDEMIAALREVLAAVQAEPSRGA